MIDAAHAGVSAELTMAFLLGLVHGITPDRLESTVRAFEADTRAG